MNMISVIVPIYNGEQYILKTATDILNQKYKNIELLLVNDGSTDSSLKLCNQIAQKDKRVRVFTKSNGGICSARNYGIQQCSGDYISFIDQDDQIDPCIYEVLSKGISQGADLIVAGKEMSEYDSSDNLLKREEYNPISLKIYNKDEIRYYIFNSNGDNALLHLWNCLYKSSIIKECNIHFQEKLKNGLEDSLFNVIYSMHCNSISFQRGIVYHYMNRHGVSTSTKKNSNYLYDFNIFADDIMCALDELNITDPSWTNFVSSYLYRLSYNLYYSHKNDVNITNHEQLQTLLDIVRNKFGLIYIKRNTIYSLPNYIYINLLNWLISHKVMFIAKQIIDLKNRI